MDNIYELFKYFPNQFADINLNSYFKHHSEHFTKCIENELYASAYPHLHILYMIFIYTQLYRISKEKNENFNLCWIGMPSYEKDFLKNPSTPLSFSGIKEKTVFRFFRLVGFQDGLIGNISSVVNMRNDQLHANGIIKFNTGAKLEKEIENYLNRMKQVVENQYDFLSLIYNSIITSFDSDYQFTDDDMITNLVIPYYFSENELSMLVRNKEDNLSKYLKENLL